MNPGGWVGPQWGIKVLHLVKYRMAKASQVSDVAHGPLVCVYNRSLKHNSLTVFDDFSVLLLIMFKSTCFKCMVSTSNLRHLTVIKVVKIQKLNLFL